MALPSGYKLLAIPKDFGLSNGDSIVTFDNAVSGQNDGSQATSGNRAVIAGGETPASVQVASFDGTNDEYSFGNIMSGWTSGSIFIIVKNNGDGNSALWVTGGSSGYYATGGGSNLFESWGQTSRDNFTTGDLKQWRMHSVVVKSDGTWKVFQDGTEKLSYTRTAAFPTDFILGRNSDPIYLNGKVAAILAYDRDLNSSEQAQVKDHFANLFQLTSLGYVPPDTTPPTTISDLTFVSKTTHQITVSFTTPTDAGSGVAGYEYTLDNGSTWNAFTVTGTSTKTGTVSNLTQNTSYTIKVRAYDAELNYATASNGVTQTTDTLTTISSLAATGQNSTEISFSYSAPSDAAGYQYRVDGGSWQALSPSGTSTKTFTLSTLTPGVEYDVEVRSYDGKSGTPNYSAASNLVSAFTKPRIDTTSLPDGTVGTPYSYTMTKTGGSGSWSIESGAPTGASFDGADFEIADLTGLEGDYSIVFRFTQTDSTLYIEKTLSLTIEPEPPPDFKEFPIELSGLQAAARYSTMITRGKSGNEVRVRNWTYPLREYDFSFLVRTRADVETLVEFFHSCAGNFSTFYLYDTTESKYDFTRTELGGNGVRTEFQMVKRYTDVLGGVSYRPVKRIKRGTVAVKVNGAEQVEDTDYTIDYGTGIITFASAPANDAIITQKCEFYVKVRFVDEVLPVSQMIHYLESEANDLFQIPAIPVKEVRE